MKNINVLTTIYAAMAVVLTSCTSQNGGLATYPIDVSIDLDRTYSDLEIDKFTSKIDMRLLKLDTSNDEALFGGVWGHDLYQHNDDIYVIDDSKAILIFEKDGSFKRKIERIGRGPEEYLHSSGIFVTNDSIIVNAATSSASSINAGKSIMVYDTLGTFINKSKLNVAGGYFTPYRGNMLTFGKLTDDYIINTYSIDGELKGQLMKQKEDNKDFPLQAVLFSPISVFDNELFFTNYFDNSIYTIKGDSVMSLWNLDFGRYNLPSDMLLGDSKNKSDKFTEYRKKYVIGVEFVIANRNYITFNSLKRVFFSRKDNSYMISEALDRAPFNLLNQFVQGCNSDGEFYADVTGIELKEVLLQLDEQGDLDEYSFLKELDINKINDEEQWILFYKIN